MGHTPFGYRIVNGSAVIEDSEAQCIRQMFRNYLDGMSLSDTAKSAGLCFTHSHVKRLLMRSCYCGDDFYPPIIDEATFRNAQAEILKRAAACHQLGKTRKTKPVALKEFIMGSPLEQLEGPYEQAEYVYSLIESKVTSCQK